MEWFNFYGLIFVAIIMIPNLIFVIKQKDGFVNFWKNKTVEIFEQIGRYCCFIFMFLTVPKTYWGFKTESFKIAYIITESVLTLAYCIIWAVLFRKNCKLRSLSLSIIPSLVFLFGGIFLRYILLIFATAIFAPCHILLSYKNTCGYLKNKIEESDVNEN